MGTNAYSISLIYSKNILKLSSCQPDYMLTLQSGSLTKRYYCGTYAEALNIVAILGLAMTNEDKALYRLNDVLNNRAS